MAEQPNDNKISNNLTRILFTIYLIVLGWILLLKLGVQFSYMEKRNLNFIPYNDYFMQGKIDAAETILNILIFVPLGIYAGILFKKWTTGKKFLFFFLVSLGFEALQFILKIGAFDITDIINNTLGGIIGFGIFKTIERILNDNRKAHKLINLFATIGTIVMIALLVLLKMNMLPIRYQ